MKNLPLGDTLNETSFNLCSVWKCSLLTGIRRGHIRNLSLECPWNVSGSSEHPVWKKHHRELFNLISNCSSTHFCVPAVSLFSSRSCIHCLFLSIKNQPKCTLQSKLSNLTNCENQHKPQCLRMKSAHHNLAPVCPFAFKQGNKGKTGVIIAAYMHYSKISAGWVCLLETSKATSWHFLVRHCIDIWNTLRIIKPTCENVWDLNSAL